MTASPPDPVDAILAAHGIRGPWEPLPATGVANRIYATRDVVLRVATDHPDAVPDARTESVAAPVARAAGLPVPELLAFDDSRALVDRPYSLWERVHGETLGLVEARPGALPRVWREAGRELARLHERVEACPDPNGWLDTPARDLDVAARVPLLVERALLPPRDASALLARLERLRPFAAGSTPRRFLHYDLHAMNLMCRGDGALLAVLDWGDAGWGDPALELASVPPPAVPFVLEGYQQERPAGIDRGAERRIAWDLIAAFVDDALEGKARPSFAALQRALDAVLHPQS